MDVLELTVQQTRHRPWDQFSSMESAAIAFTLMHTRHATN
jgi:hypothetical protein